MEFDHILLIGFGGPTSLEEVGPFLEVVTQGRQIPEERLREVLDHYEKVGGRSPYNAAVFALADNLRKALQASDANLPLFVGMKSWHPLLRDTLAQIKERRLKKGIGVILAPHRSAASFERYVRSVEEAKALAGCDSLEYEYLKPWHDRPFFIEAQADEIRKVLNGRDAEGKSLRLIFSAHSIPLEMARQCSYQAEFETSCRLVAEELEPVSWGIAYQSRSGSPREPWLGPNVLSGLDDLAKSGLQGVICVPIGFVCDNVEILYGLDIEVRQAAVKRGLSYFRARTVSHHPKFVQMLTALIKDAICESSLTSLE